MYKPIKKRNTVFLVLVLFSSLFLAGCFSKHSEKATESRVPSTEEKNPCGDGFCDNNELLSKACPQDCGVLETKKSSEDPPCGDGFCDNNELLAKSCTEDCGEV